MLGTFSFRQRYGNDLEAVTCAFETRVLFVGQGFNAQRACVVAAPFKFWW